MFTLRRDKGFTSVLHRATAAVVSDASRRRCRTRKPASSSRCPVESPPLLLWSGTDASCYKRASSIREHAEGPRGLLVLDSLPSLHPFSQRDGQFTFHFPHRSQHVTESGHLALGDEPLSFTFQFGNGYWSVASWFYAPHDVSSILQQCSNSHGSLGGSMMGWL